MIADDFLVEMVGHATLRVHHDAKVLLTDPWLGGPILCNDGFPFPPLVHDAAEVARGTDAIFLSHAHPDHFHLPSLELFDRGVPVYLARHASTVFADRVRSLGFTVVEIEPRETVRVAGTQIELTVVEHDGSEPASLDTSVVIATPRFSLVNTNDCPLRRDQYEWIRERFAPDHAFLGYSAVSHYPLSFEMDEGEKRQRMHESSERHLRAFVEAACLLNARLTVPFANGMRFLDPAALWRNVAFNSGAEAARRACRCGLRTEVMGPGDRIRPDGTIVRRTGVLDAGAELAAIERHARTLPPMPRPRARATTHELAARMRDHVLGLWSRARAQYPAVAANVIAYDLPGPPRVQFHFDFSRDAAQIFRWGEPDRYDMRFRYPSAALEMTLDGVLDWDELHFTNEVSIHQRAYAREYDAMLRRESRIAGDAEHGSHE